jgi:hypothetical protein
MSRLGGADQVGGALEIAGQVRNGRATADGR